MENIARKKVRSNLANIYWSLIPKYILLTVTLLSNKVHKLLILHSFYSEARGIVKIINRICYCIWPRETTCTYFRLFAWHFFPHKALWFVNILLPETSDLFTQEFLTVNLKRCISSSCYNLRILLLIIPTGYCL